MNGQRSRQSHLTGHASRWLVPVTILALSLVAIEAILQPSLPCSDDAAFHLLRLTQLDHLLRQGVLFSRWAPDMAQGYGFPFFNFYAPLSYYLAEGVSLLVGNLNLGMRITFALGIFLAGLTAYRLSRDHFSQPAAIVTAVAYMYAPYYAYDILFRGNLAESMAWLFLPLSLWTMGRLARTRKNRWLVAAALSYAAVLLTHNVFALIFSPLLGLYGLVELNDQRLKIKEWHSKANLQSLIINLWPVILAILLGLGLTTFFWLPAMIERAYVHSDRLLVPPIFVYWGNFVTLAEIFMPPQTVFTNLINPSPSRSLGLVPLLLALPALVAGWWVFKDSRRRQVIFFGVATAVYIFLMIAASEPVWANLPLIEYVQFPWRLLGPAALCLSILVGASIDIIMHYASRITIVMASLYCLALILGSLYWFDARYCPGLEDPTVADMQEFERATLTIGTTAKGEYLPLTVAYMPEDPALELFEKLPETAVLQSASRTPKQFTALVSASEPFVLTANTFDYPGWQAEINDEEVDIIPSEGTGLITILVPAGENNITITFRETPLRLLANGVSLVSLLVLLLVASGRWQVARVQWDEVAELQGGNVVELVVLAIVGVVVFALVVWVLPRFDTVVQDSRVPSSGITAQYNNQIAVLAYELEAREMAADDSLLVQSNWQALAPVAGDFRETVRLVGPDGRVWSPKTAVSPRWYRQPTPTYAWSTNQFADSQLLIEPIAGTPPGLYTIQMLLFDEETLVTVPLPDGQTQFELGSVQINRPEKAVELTPQYLLAQSWYGINLAGVSLDREAAAPGDPFLLSLYWQVAVAPENDARVILSLVDENDEAMFIRELSPVRDDFPTSEWQVHDAWVGQHLFRLPVALESGEYQWELQWCVADECAVETAVLGPLVITAPDRQFAAPPLEREIDTKLGEITTLLGANLTAQPSDLQAALVWQADNETTTSYRVFVHLVDENGQIVAQSDGEPAAWTRPTTGWLPGEIVLDVHTISLENVPPGSYQLNIGLYDPETGDRLVVAGGGTAVIIPDVTIP